MIRESQACLVVRFHNQTRDSLFWSKCGQRRHRGLDDAVNYLMWMVNEYKPWQGQIARAAIFDTRSTKDRSGENKLYQYDRFWKLEKSLPW